MVYVHVRVFCNMIQDLFANILCNFLNYSYYESNIFYDKHVYKNRIQNKTSVIVMAKKSLSNIKYLVSYLDVGGRPLIRFDKRILNLILVIQRN